MTDPTPASDVLKLAALDTYLKVLDPMAKDLRKRVTADMGRQGHEKLAAKLPDGIKLASVTRSDGRKTAKVTDEAAALAWCLKNHPEEIVTVQSIRPSFLAKLLAAAKTDGYGIDKPTGEVLPFIEVVQGNPYVTIFATDEGDARMEALAHGFAAMLEAGPAPESSFPANDPYDPAMADRLENGGYR